VNYRFPKNLRLTKKTDFKNLLKNRKRFSSAFFSIDYHFGTYHLPKMGLSVPKSYGKAHERNRFKRIFREVFRTCHFHFPKNLEINVTPKNPAKTLKTPQLQQQLLSLFHDIKP
jgi:ribonuclease P protein component